MNPSIPYERYQGTVIPPLAVLLAFYGLIPEPIGFTKRGTPIMPIAGGDGTDTAVVTVLDRLRAKRDAAEAAAKALLTGAEAENRDLADAELDKVKEYRAEIDRRDAQIADLEALEQRAIRAAAAGSVAHPGKPLSAVAGPRVDVTRNEPTYRRDGQHSWAHDIYQAMKNGDTEARERLLRNDREALALEQRDGSSNSAAPGSTSFGSFIAPVWLIEQFAYLARVGRVLAPYSVQGGDPTTNSMVVPRITTGSTVAGQGSDNAAVSETDIVTAQLTRPTITVAGQQDVSLQSIDLASSNVDQIIFADLMGAYNAEVDRQILRGSGSGELLGINQVSGINSVSLTTATVVAAYPKIFDALQRIHANRFMPGEIIVMHPRRWGWFLAAVDSQNRPLVVPSAPVDPSIWAVNPMGQFSSTNPQGPVGNIGGLPVVLDANIATTLGGGTEDQIVIYRPSDTILYEGRTRTRILEQTLSGTLTVRFQLYAYLNFFAGRFPSGISTIGGSGLVTPTF